MSFDITHILDSWDYLPGQVIVRRFKGRDGTEKIQLRVDLGLLQMNATGRPDGKRPFGFDSVLDYYKSKKTKAAEAGTASGEETEFKLDAEACSKIQQELVQFHHRYICFYQLGDFESVLRDTARNVQAIEFVEKHAATEDLVWPVQQFTPQMLMMRTRSRAAILLAKKDFDGAIQLVETGMEEIREFYHRFSRQDLLEQSGEIRSLETWLDEIRGQKPLTEREQLEKALTEAVAREDYEEAAKYRDALKNLKSSNA